MHATFFCVFWDAHNSDRTQQWSGNRMVWIVQNNGPSFHYNCKNAYWRCYDGPSGQQSLALPEEYFERCHMQDLHRWGGFLSPKSTAWVGGCLLNLYLATPVASVLDECVKYSLCRCHRKTDFWPMYCSLKSMHAWKSSDITDRLVPICFLRWTSSLTTRPQLWNLCSIAAVAPLILFSASPFRH